MAKSLGSSLLIALLIALPISGLTAVAVIAESTQPTTAERIAATLGNSQAMVKMISAPDPDLTQDPVNPNQWWLNNGNAENAPNLAERPVPDIRAVLADTELAPVFDTSVMMKTATGVASMRAVEGRPWDPSLVGRFTLLDGRTPERVSEIMATESALIRLGVRIGQTVEMRDPLERTLTVVGTLDSSAEPSSQEMIFGQTAALSADIDPQVRLLGTEFYLPTRSLNWPAVQKLNTEGATVLSRDVLLDPPNVTTPFPDNSGSSLGSAVGMALILAAFTVFEVVLLAGAAFAVTARQLQRTLAIVASVGGTRSTLFRIISAKGVVLGALGGIIGVVLGIAASAVVMAFTSNGSASRYYGFHLNWAILTGIVLFAAIVGWIAALAPALAASRLDIVGALRGARRPPVAGRRRPIIGVTVMAVGAALTLLGGILLIVWPRDEQNDGGTPGVAVIAFTVLVVVGPIIAQIGLALCGPFMLRGIAALFRRAGLGARLATRDAARNPARSVPAFTAILTTVFVAVFAMCLMTSQQASSDESYSFAKQKGQISSALSYYGQSGGATVQVKDPAPFVQALSDNIPVSAIRVLSASLDSNAVMNFGLEGPVGDPQKGNVFVAIPAENACPLSQRSSSYRTDFSMAERYKYTGTDPRCSRGNAPDELARIWVGDAADLALVLGRAPSAEAVRALADGRAVSLYSGYVHSDRIELGWWSAAQVRDEPSGSASPLSKVSIGAVVDSPDYPIGFTVFISSPTARSLGVTSAPTLVLAAPTATPSNAQLDAARAATGSLTGDSIGYTFSIENGPTPYGVLTAWILLGISALIAIGASTVAIGLARFDGRMDDATLDSLGAGPRTRRSFAFWQSLVLVGLGAILGSALGVLPALALQLPGSGQVFAPPWLQIGLVAIALPLVIATISWCAAGRPSRMTRRTPVA